MQPQRGNNNPFPEKYTMHYNAANGTGGTVKGCEPYHTEDDARKGYKAHTKRLPEGYKVVSAGIFPPFGEGGFITLVAAVPARI